MPPLLYTGASTPYHYKSLQDRLSAYLPRTVHQSDNPKNAPDAIELSDMKHRALLPISGFIDTHLRSQCASPHCIEHQKSFKILSIIFNVETSNAATIHAICNLDEAQINIQSFNDAIKTVLTKYQKYISSKKLEPSLQQEFSPHISLNTLSKNTIFSYLLKNTIKDFYDATKEHTINYEIKNKKYAQSIVEHLNQIIIFTQINKKNESMQQINASLEALKSIARELRALSHQFN